METSTPCKYKTVKDIEEPSRSRVVVQNFTEIGSPILGGQVGEVLVFYLHKILKTSKFKTYVLEAN